MFRPLGKFCNQQATKQRGQASGTCLDRILERESPGGEALAGQRGFGFVPFPMQQTGHLAFGDFTDEPVAASAAEFLKRDHLKPFFLGVSVHNPHDICYWVMDKLPPGHPARAEFDVAVSKLPPVPRNHAVSPEEPDFIAMCRRRKVYGPENTYTTDWDESAVAAIPVWLLPHD